MTDLGASGPFWWRVSTVRWPAWLALALGMAWLCGTGLFRLRYYGYFSPAIFDDAYFFVRYADNFLDTGVFSWNPGAGAVYGNTSQLYQLLVTAVYVLTDRDTVLSLTLAPQLGAFAYAGAVPLAYLAARPQADRTTKLLVCATGVLFIAFDAQLHLIANTGMETSWTMALVALSLAATFRLRSASPAAVVLAGASIALVYAMRPDATLIAIAAPAGLGLLAQGGLRRAALATIAVAAALIGLIVLACWLYYGDPLPLAFISKNPLLTFLPASGYREFLGDPSSILLFMGLLHYPEIILCLAALTLRGLPLAARGALLGALLFALYHVTLVLPIMASYARYYAPAMPAIVLGAMFAVEAMVRRSGIVGGWRQLNLSGLAMFAGVGLLLVCKAYPLVLNTVYAYGQAPALDDGRNSKDGALANAAEQYYFFGGRLTQLVAALGKDCSASSTEDGLLAAYAKGSRIVDISALHDRTMERDGFSADRVLLRQRPDVLIMPHPHYVDWTQALLNHPAMTRDYELVPPLTDKSAAIAFRRDSACAQRVRLAVYGR